MYKLLLILKYLRKRRIAWVSLIAVTLCTAMVLVVISVMGGWLRMFEENFRKVTGDVVITAPHTGLRGFAYYDRIIAGIEKLPEVKAAVPVIQGFGLLNIDNQKSEGVQVIGYPIDQAGKVNTFPKSLYWQYKRYVEEAERPGVSRSEREALLKKAEESAAHPSFDFSPLDPQSLQVIKARYRNAPGMILSSPLLAIGKNGRGQTTGRDLWKYELPVKLVMFDPTKRDFADLSEGISTRAYIIADDSRIGAWQFDEATVYVPFEMAQKDMGMDAQGGLTTASGQTLTRPARAHQIHVRIAEGVDLKVAGAKIQAVINEVMAQAREENDRLGAPGWWAGVTPEAETWRQNKAAFLNAVENEKVLVVFLMSMISVVAVFLIFCIFYMIVVEKTRDIGIIKAVGATSRGVAIIFLGYGAAIGIVGGGLGFLAGYGIIHNINYIHAQLGHWLGIEIWKPEVYAFDTIPNQINPHEAMIIVAVAIVSSVLGSLVPAIRASRMNPVEAVRYE